MGVQQGTDLAVLVNDPKKTLAEGAITAWPKVSESPLFSGMLRALSQQLGIPLDVPFERLDPRHKRWLLHGTGERWMEVSSLGLPVPREPQKSKRKGNSRHSPLTPPNFSFQYKGLYPAMEEAGRVSYTFRQQLFGLTGEVPCSNCDGSRLRDDAANVRLRGLTLQQLCELPLSDSLQFLRQLKLSASEKKIAGELLREATQRLSFLVDVGLDYLTLARPLPTLSGGECQRIRLAGQIGRALTGVLYVLDEPTIGLHPRDNGRLLAALKKLRDLGNTLVLVEHDREVLRAADRLYDFGPGAGRLGGTITAEGSPEQLGRSGESLTGQFLSGRREIPIPVERRMPRAERQELQGQGTDRKPHKPTPLSSQLTAPRGWLELTGARHHNLRNVHLKIPLGTLTVVTGVSGSGKSSLIQETLAKAVARKLHRVNETPGAFDELLGLEQIDKLIVVDQQPIGNTPKSNPGTFTGAFDEIRELFAQLPEARLRGWRAGRFSFNRSGGRCEACEGNGQKLIEMHFLPDIWIECDQCRGKRYNTETLSVKYRGQTIADVLDMPIGNALKLFENVPRIRGPLATLCAVGLDYLTLGQPAPTLSGGEAQRVKLAAELARPQTGRTLYILDEPTTGLHFDDIDKLLKVLNSLVEKGNTVVVIEHNLDVIKTADWLIDLGPEAGDGGGWIVAEGTPEEVVEQFRVSNAKSRVQGHASRSPFATRHSPFVSHTAAALAPILASGTRGQRAYFDADAVRRKQAGDVTTGELGRSVKMPWQIDGRKWHLVDRRAANGRPCRWDGAMLERIVDFLEGPPLTETSATVTEPLAEPGLKNSRVQKLRSALAGRVTTAATLLSEQTTRRGSSPFVVDPQARLTTNWSERNTVEMFGPDTSRGWFLQATTSDEWLLTLKIRVPENTFDPKSLAVSLPLKPISELRDLDANGRGERVQVKSTSGPWQEITLTLFRADEIDTPEFWQFLKHARCAYLSKTGRRRKIPR
jgi:excinuclease ABC subunit A